MHVLSIGSTEVGRYVQSIGYEEADMKRWTGRGAHDGSLGLVSMLVCDEMIII